MKTIIPTVLLLFSVVTFSKAEHKPYYWVVESTACLQGSSVIRIYNEKHELVYTEKIEGKVLDLKDCNVHKRLNRKARKVKALREKV